MTTRRGRESATQRQKRKAPPKLFPLDRLDYNTVLWVAVESIQPSPENNQIYGEVQHDDAMDALVASIRKNNLGEPFLVTEDGSILSGHRRYHAVKYMGWKEIPVRIVKGKRREGNDTYHLDLADYNPQRIKSVGSLLREALLRDNTAADTYAAIEERAEASMHVDAKFMDIGQAKSVRKVSPKQQEFLAAVKKWLDENQDDLPVSIRGIHYGLVSLRVKPLKLVCKSSRFSDKHHRYKNDRESYNALVRLLTAARYSGEVAMNCIDDPTRPQRQYGGFSSVDSFVSQEISGFLDGFHRNKQDDQPRYIHVFGEKNTIMRRIERACEPYGVPFCIGRGFCSIPVWRDIAEQFERSGKKRMTLIIVSDYDPEGLELADDAIRSLGLHIDPSLIDGMRVAVTPEQIEELELAEDFNPAKTEGSRYKAFVKRTGSNKTWEVDVLPAQYTIDCIQAAIEANMDLEIYNRICDQEEEDCEKLCRIRGQIASQLEF